MSLRKKKSIGGYGASCYFQKTSCLKGYPCSIKKTRGQLKIPSTGKTVILNIKKNDDKEERKKK